MTEEILNQMTEDELMEYLVSMEFEIFDKTRNEGGRASCQDDWETFHIMRKSQYMTWTREMIISLIIDFENTRAGGWNMISEKYARMMETTMPDEYEQIKDGLPPVSDEKRALVEQVVAIQVQWMEEFAAAHPNVSIHARRIHTAEDVFYATSAETYLRGELLTYSDHTLYLYAMHIAGLARQGKNITEMTMLHTIRMYGYQSFDDVKG